MNVLFKKYSSLAQEKVFSDTFGTAALAVYEEFDSADTLASSRASVPSIPLALSRKSVISTVSRTRPTGLRYVFLFCALWRRAKKM